MKNRLSAAITVMSVSCLAAQASQVWATRVLPQRLSPVTLASIEEVQSVLASSGDVNAIARFESEVCAIAFNNSVFMSGAKSGAPPLNAQPTLMVTDPRVALATGDRRVEPTRQLTSTRPRIPILSFWGPTAYEVPATPNNGVGYDGPP